MSHKLLKNSAEKGNGGKGTEKSARNLGKFGQISGRNMFQ